MCMCSSNQTVARIVTECSRFKVPHDFYSLRHPDPETVTDLKICLFIELNYARFDLHTIIYYD